MIMKNKENLKLGIKFSSYETKLIGKKRVLLHHVSVLKID